MDDSRKQFVQFLEKFQVPQACIQFITQESPGLGLGSISDFASIFTDDDYAQGVKNEIAVKVESEKDNLRTVARLRTAWQMAKAELTKACKRRIEGGPETDWDTPLDDTAESQRRKDFEAAYGGMIFDTESTPGAALIGRWFREFRSSQRQISVISIHKMRSEADFKQLGTAKKQRLAEGLSLVQDDRAHLPDISFDNAMRLLAAFRLMTNGWALTGYSDVESKSEFDNQSREFIKVKNCHLKDAIGYYDFVFRKAQEHGGPDQAVIRWIIDRDRQTRAKARSLYAQGWPWGEALVQAKDVHCGVLWTVAGTGVSQARPQPVLPSMDATTDGQRVQSRRRQGERQQSGPQQGRRQQGEKKVKLQTFCQAFNSASGCTKKGKKCPHGKLHRCSKCKGFTHGASTCRQA